MSERAATDIRHLGPMGGERSRRHQMTAESNSRRAPEEGGTRGILTIYEVEPERQNGVSGNASLYVEVMVDGFTNQLRLTVAEARELAGAAAEFVRCWQDEESSNA